MKATKRIWRMFTLLGVVTAAVIAGIFLSSYEALAARGKRPPTSKPATTRGVDINEVERGNPRLPIAE